MAEWHKSYRGRMKEVKVRLDRFEKALAIKIGDGDLCLGVRRAVALTGLRSGTNLLRIETMENEPDRLTIVTNQMASLAEELSELDGNYDRREEIAVQLIRLGKLYMAIRSGSDLSQEDR